MFKSIGKAAAYLALLLCTAAISGLVTYTVTVNILKNRAADTVQTVAAENVKPKTEENADSEQETKKSVPPARQNCYVVRLEDSHLAVYASLDGKEEFLYSEPVSVCDLSADDERLLEEGVRLKDSSELTGFLENFTS